MGSHTHTVSWSGYTKMISLLVVPFLLSSVSSFPGGYTGLGGLYKNMNQNADYIPHAKNAARLAEQIAFETDESLVGGGQGRPARKAVYVPNFFTAEPQPVVASGVSQAQTVELPVYHNAYRAPDQQVVYAQETSTKKNYNYRKPPSPN